MNIYPDLATSLDSNPEPIDGLSVDRSMDGAGHMRVLMSSDPSKFSVKHPMIDATTKATLDAFYSANRGLRISYTNPNDGITYTVYMRKPKYTRLPGNYWDASVPMEQA